MAINVSTKDYNYRVHSGDSAQYAGFTTRWEAVSHAVKLTKNGKTPTILGHDKERGYIRDETAHSQLATKAAPSTTNGSSEAVKIALGELSSLALQVKKIVNSKDQDGLDDLKAALADKYHQVEELIGL